MEPMANQLPLHTLHARLGAVFDSPCGWDLPFSYGNPEAEYRAVRTAAGIMDHSHAGVLEVTGRDRVAFLQGMLTNDLKALGPGQGCPAAFLDAHGKVQALLTVLVLGERLLLILNGASAEKTLQALDKFLISEKVSFRDVSAETALFLVAGPSTAAVIGRLTGEPPLPTAGTHAERKVGGISVRVITGGEETGEPGVWLLAPASSAEEIWTKTMEAGRPVGLSPVGVTALDVLRVEAGTPWYGHDVDETVLLPEIPLDRYVSYTKGCYIGQEVVARVKYRGHVNRSLTGLTFDGDRVPKHDAAIQKDDSDAGRVTSAVHSFALNRPIALAFVRREYLEPGTPVTVKDGDQALTARVTALPFYRRA